MGILLRACGKKADEDAKRLDHIGSMIDAVFNENWTDLAEGLSEGELDKIIVHIDKVDETDFNEENEKRFEELNTITNWPFISLS